MTTLALPGVCLLAAMLTLPAGATRFWPFDTDAERLVEQARLSRLRQDFSTANSLLDQANGKDPQVEPGILCERGLLARDRGDLEHALTLLHRAADLDPMLPARVDQAGILVQLGRWPEAVVVLRQAFDERGMSLTVDQVTSDKRFVKLSALKPYQDVIDAARTEQAGPFGRVLMRLERLQSSVGTSEHAVQRLAAWLAFFRELAAEQITAVVWLICMGLFAAFGVRELGLFKPPWSLLVGMSCAGAVWGMLVYALTQGQSWGRDSIAWAASGVLGLWGLGAGLRWGWRRIQRARRGAGDPFAAENLPDTLILVDEVSRLGHRVVSARRREQRVIAEALRQAGETLRERLDKGA